MPPDRFPLRDKHRLCRLCVLKSNIEIRDCYDVLCKSEFAVLSKSAFAFNLYKSLKIFTRGNSLGRNRKTCVRRILGPGIWSRSWRNKSSVCILWYISFEGDGDGDCSRHIYYIQSTSGNGWGGECGEECRSPTPWSVSLGNCKALYKYCKYMNIWRGICRYRLISTYPMEIVIIIIIN